MDFSWSTLIIVILVVLVIYFVWSMLASSSSSTVISSEQDASAQTTISISDKTYSFALSAWIYVSDWSSTSGEKSIISSESDTSQSSYKFRERHQHIKCYISKQRNHDYSHSKHSTSNLGVDYSECEQRKFHRYLHQRKTGANKRFTNGMEFGQRIAVRWF